MRRLVAVLAVAVSACGAPATPAPVKPAPAKPRPATTKPTDRLKRALAAVPDASEVAGALSEDLRSEVLAITRGLAPEELQILRDPGGAVSESRPLLSLLVAGESPRALWLLASTPRAAAELAEARQRAGGTDFVALRAPSLEVQDRAARRWLRDRALDVDGGQPELFDAIARLATILRRHDLARLALESRGPAQDRLERRALAIARARDLDAEGAARALGEDTDPEVLELLAAARTLAARSDVSPAARLGRARAALALLRFDDARSELDAAPSRDADLGAAVARALVLTRGGSCYGGAPEVELGLLCSAGPPPGDSDVSASIARAWTSGSGRDETALEGYFGFQLRKAWLSELGGGAWMGSAERARAAHAALGAIGAAANDAATGAPRFAGISLFVDVVDAFVRAAESRKPSDRLRIAPATADSLRARARAMAADARHPWQSAAVLAVAAALLTDYDVSELALALPEGLPREQRATRAAVLAWSAIARQSADLASRARTELGELAASAEGLQRSESVLLVAELDAALEAPGGRAEDVLARTAITLAEQASPPALRLRALLDVSGALRGLGDAKRAHDLLAELVHSMPVPDEPAAADLHAIARGQVEALAGLAATGADIGARREALSIVFAGETNVPASHAAWLRSWLAELDYRAAEPQCRVKHVCAAATRRSQVNALDSLSTAVGAEAARLVRAGTLPAGSFQPNIGFGSTGLALHVWLPLMLVHGLFPATPPTK